MNKQILAELSKEKVWEHVVWLTENAPERISGSQDERTAALAKSLLGLREVSRLAALDPGVT